MKVKFEWNDPPDRIAKKEAGRTVWHAFPGDDCSTLHGSLRAGG